MPITEVQPRRWTRDEYYQMLDLGFFIDQRVELIDGEIIEMPAQKDVHAIIVGVAHKVLDRLFGDTHWTRMQLPLTLPDDSEPEPDVSVVPGSPRDYLGKGHPKSALLVVEVSDTTLRFDRRRKAPVYASAGIQDYWIINLIDMQIEVHRKPFADPSQPHGFRYDETFTLKAGQSLAPLARPQASISVADLLP
jgi:Uma2 family endonuclease